MFHNAALKLTTWYLAIIMGLSVGCSVVIYHFSSDEIVRSNTRQIPYFNDLAPGEFRSFNTFRQEQIDEGNQRLLNDLVVFNVLVLLFGGAASYALARRTLSPIEESLESQKRFAADASHELRTPLTAMQTEIEVALRNPKLSRSEAIDQLKSNLEEVAKLRALSEGLLKLASQDGKLALDETVSIKDTLNLAIERVNKIAEAKKINILLKGQDRLVHGDRQSLIDLVAILLDNAIKYSEPETNIALAYGQRTKQVFFSISDKGQGIAAKDLPRIFDRFYRADTSRSKNQTQGYGLGLALAKKIADIHQGHIEVKSAPGKGSTFTVYLPLA